MKRFLKPYLLGAAGALAMPPFFVFPLLAVMYTGWFKLLGGCASKKQAFFASWLVGLGYFTVGLYWVCLSLTVDIARFGWLIPFALIGLNGLIALFFAFAGLAFKAFSNPKSPIPKPVLFVACAFTFELARSFMFTGFPWNLAGYTWSFSAYTLQLTHWIGIYGLTLLTIAAATLPTLPRKQAALGLAAFIALMGAGALRLVNAPQTEFAEGITLRLVQPNIPQSQKWDEARASANLRELLTLSQDAKATHIIWPEAAIPYPLGEDKALETFLTTHIKPQQTLLTGALFLEGDKVMNSLAALSAGGIQAVYHKHHLVPFGEYVPLRGILPIEKIVPGFGDLTSGGKPQTLSIAGIPAFAPQICYEGIFSGEVLEKNSKAQWMLNVTNDAWFGHSTGPYQHFYITRVRAVEEGLPLVRVGNTGISGVFDSYGRITARTKLGEQIALNTGLPKNQ